MSMIGEYLRITPAELERAVSDPCWALERAEQVMDAQEEDEPVLAEARHFSTYKTWNLLGFLLQRFGFPVDVVHGEEPFAGEEDWGYGPPRFLPVERVLTAAQELEALSYDDLLRGVDVGELTQAQVYPMGWEERSDLEWARDYYGRLVLFFRAAAASGDAIIAWLD